MNVLPLPHDPASSAPGDLTVLAVINLYLSHLKRRVETGDYSAHAYEDAERDLRRFAGVYGQQVMGQCRKYDLTAWFDANPQWDSPHTRKRMWGTLVRPFLWAEDQELIAKSPYKKPRDLKITTQPRQPATVEDYVLLMRYGNRPLRRALFFLRRTGARTCEMREITWPEVDFERGVIVKQWHKTSRKDPKPRLIGLDPATLRFLRNLYRQRPPNQDRVFLNRRKTPWDRHTFARCLRRVAERIGVGPEMSAYGLRHLWAVTAVEIGLPDKSVADQLGHSSTRLIPWYAAQTSSKTDHLRRVASAAIRRRRD